MVQPVLSLQLLYKIFDNLNSFSHLGFSRAAAAHHMKPLWAWHVVHLRKTGVLISLTFTDFPSDSNVIRKCLSTLDTARHVNLLFQCLMKSKFRENISSGISASKSRCAKSVCMSKFDDLVLK